ncbi:hypothetical protein CALVIDRAFT_535731 [Calocera viscosa TUFC12733]|uniref:RRM domain-containing protein n=1 Tax=Calocera viscosa (strain TUFC12733) TaxID=1330018 RepID=A0A167NW08_CALVF|nr:hypothetical protein CALVIDRAFT_535731 [Calocera viscosa TUFC12733]
MSVSQMEEIAEVSGTSEKKLKKTKKVDADAVAGKKRKRSEVEAEEQQAPGPTADDGIPLLDEEAPLSHKQLRKTKKKALKAEDTTTTVDGKPAKPSAAQSPDKPIRQNSVWVGNLAFKTLEPDIRQFFAGCGTITRVHMPRKMAGGPEGGMRGQNMGFAYVDFDTTEARDKAIKLSENPLHGRKLLIKDGNDYRGRPTATQKAAQATGEEDGTTSKPAITKTAQKILKSQNHPPGPTLFVGNLGFEATKETITEMLQGHHKTAHATKKVVADDEDGTKAETEDTDLPDLGLRKVRLGTFEDSGFCKGWAFLDFHTTAQAQAVLINGRNHNLNGRKLVVEFGSADAVRRGGHSSAHAATHAAARGEGEEGTKRKFGGGKSAGYLKRGKGNGEHPETGAAGAGDDVPSAFPAAAGAAEEDERPAKRQRPDRERPPTDRPRRGLNDRPVRRLKPGAALALAVQSTAKTGAIVASQGKKITFS